MNPQNVANSAEYQTYQIGVAYLLVDLLNRLGIAEIIDGVLEHQPKVGVSYGKLALVVIINRLSFDPQPLYGLGKWAAERGIDRLLGIEAHWLDDDRLGAMLDGLAKQAATIWSQVLVKAVKEYAIVLEWLHADTTSVYFEGVYADEAGNTPAEARCPRLVQGYNKDGKPDKVQFVLSLISQQRIPLWYQPWDGNQSDDEVYLADWQGLKASGVAVQDAVLIFDRKGCNQATMLSLCQTNQSFLGAHPWTPTAKAAWENLAQELQSGARQWSEVNYVARKDQPKPAALRPRYRIGETAHTLVEPVTGKSYPLRWLFSWNSSKAALDARQRQQALLAGEQALQRVQRLLGKYDYTQRTTIATRLEKALTKAKAYAYYRYTLSGDGVTAPWCLTWETDTAALTSAEQFDGVALLCTNLPEQRLSPTEAVTRYKEQVQVEQTIAFLKGPVQIRPLWLHSPQRLAGLTLLIMLAALLASLIEYKVRQELAQAHSSLHGLLPEKRDNPYPTAEKLLKAFQDYTLIVVSTPDGRQQVIFPQLRPIQQQILALLAIHPNPG